MHGMGVAGEGHAVWSLNPWLLSRFCVCVCVCTIYRVLIELVTI